MIYKKSFKALVTNGPSKMDLVTALAYAYDKTRPQFLVKLHLVDAETKKSLKEAVWRATSKNKEDCFWAKVTGVKHEDGTGESFMIEGYLDLCASPGRPECSTPFNGYYSAKDRRGSIECIIYTADDKR